MKKYFDLFEGWLEENFKDGYLDLNPPATDIEIAKLESVLNLNLPQDLADLLRIHNGQANNASGLFDGSEFLSTRRIADEWRVWKDLLDGGDLDGYLSSPSKGVRDDWWNEKWIPFTHNGAGDHYCVDCSPDSGGNIGQVISVWHDADERKLLACSLESWFDSYVTAVLAGKYVYSDNLKCIVAIDNSRA